MSTAWPLDATAQDGMPLPPPWDGDIDICDRSVEQAFLAIHATHPDLSLRICREVFCRAEAKGDDQAALLALHLAGVTLYTSAQEELGERVFKVVFQRAHRATDPRLALRIELTRSALLTQLGEHAQAIVIRQRALSTSLALGDNQLACYTLFSLAHSATRVGEPVLALDVLRQQRQLLPDDDVMKANWRSATANYAALSWATIARDRRAAGDEPAARSALHEARPLALSACETAIDPNDACGGLETLVQILLLSGQASEAREQVDRFTAGLNSLPLEGSVAWSELHLASARIDVHTGTVSARTIEDLQTIDRLQGVVFSYSGTPLRQILVEAHECLGQYEQALACHVHATDSHPKQRSIHLRQRLKTLRHMVMSMRAEAIEFIAHDLLTPLAAARTWLQAAVRLPPCDAQLQLRNGMTVAEQYLGVLRAELLPRADLQVLDIGALADDVCENVAAPGTLGLRLTRDIDIGTPVVGDPTLLSKAMTVLLTDAFDRAPAGTLVQLRLQHDAAAGEAVLSISHSGPGPTDAVRTRLYQQFADGKVFGAGELGLALAAKVARLHRARLRLETLPGQGSRLLFSMKLDNPSPAPPQPCAP